LRKRRQSPSLGMLSQVRLLSAFRSISICCFQRPFLVFQS